ncbi:La-related protein 1A [Podospora aff. communis PSN243]|uniref:La-related protein 1A n=1 Tax=Podospora aff. communis PSN243 TaxID=3040156 RepID=A0AAV9GLL5_9PEZI|nr:La-related protein 1A [Podospora aff. communis PSN243]
MSTATVPFSYAQAAKGHAISQPSPQLTSSTATPSVKDEIPTAGTSVTAPSVASNEADARDNDKRVKSEVEGPPSKQDSEVASVGGSSTASVNGQSVRTGQESDVTMVESQQLNEEKGSRSASRTSQGNEHKKGRKGRKGRGNDKDAQTEQNHEDEKEVPKPVLLEAPVPAVNYWTKRLEANAKAKQTFSPSVNGTPGSTPVSQEAKKRQQSDARAGNGEVVNGANGEKSHKKATESSQGADQGHRRSAPRGSRANDKDDKSAAALPSVADASFWPDPKSAATTATEESSRKIQEKLEVAEKDGQEETGSNKKRNWVNLDIVPTVVFNTPLPPRGGAKTRGGARGGREAGSTRGGHGTAPSLSTSGHAAADRSAVTSSSAPKLPTSRPREGSVPSRSASQPQPALPQAAKSGSPDAASKDQRKTTNPEQSRESAPEISVASKRASSMRDIRTDPGANFEHSHSLSRNGQDRPNGTQQYAVREGRPDRGRGNGFRGRGGHANGTGSHMPSASYSSNGQQYAGYPPRHNSTAPSPPPFGAQLPVLFGQGQPHRGRGNKWSGSGHSSGRNGANGSYTVKPAPAAEFQMPPYGSYAYPPHADPLIPVIKQQIEYYFSVENLCKDTYLRKQMDSQGFVKFSTIAGFKRMRELVKDHHEMMRAACLLSDHIDYVQGDDSVERLRAREGWRNWILSYDMRDEDARNDGPANITFWNQYQQPHPYGVAPLVYPGPGSAGMYSGFSDERMFQPVYGNGNYFDPVMNGAGDPNGHVYGTGSQLSAAVQEFSPPQSPVTLETMTNFTDAQVENMMVVLGFDNNDPSGPSDDKVYLTDNAAQNGANLVSSVDAPSTTGATANSTDSDSSVKPKQPSRRPYGEIRQEALEARKHAQPGETPAPMRNLYRFWSEMLVKDFNSRVYTEFKDLAFADVNGSVPALTGIKHLLDFYRKLIYDTEAPKLWPQGRAMPSILQLHFYEAIELERARGVQVAPSI